MKEHVAAVVAELTDVEQRAVFELDEFYGCGPERLVTVLALPPAKARATLAELRRHGVANFGPLFSEDDGSTQGSGYWLDTFGRAVRDQLELNRLRWRAVADLPMTLDDVERMNELERKEHTA